MPFGGLSILHSYTHYVDMKNVTLTLDEGTLREPRRIAAERSATEAGSPQTRLTSFEG